MVTVSLSVYQDANLAHTALRSIRRTLGNVRIQVVDGRYKTYKPDAPDNSTDNIRDVCNAYGAEYHPNGPYDLERDKHVARIEIAPRGEPVLFMDADERLHDWDGDALPGGVAVSPRIFNALVYGPHTVYWPRLFRPEWVETVNSWDAFLFNVPHERSDAVTIIHRHDLRSRDYREEKYARFDREDRTGRYADDFNTYLNDEWDADFTECPECGERSVTRSQATNFAPDYSYVEACVNGDNCYAAVREVMVDEWRYLPGDWERGFEEDPARLRLELLDAGCGFVRTASASYMVENMRPAIDLWVSETLGDSDAKVFA